MPDEKAQEPWSRKPRMREWKSNRNLARPMKALSVKEDGTIRDRRNLMKWTDGKVMRTDGCFGTLVGNNTIRVSTSQAPPPPDADMDRASRICVTSGMPGRTRNFKKKGVARAHDKRDFVDTQALNLPMLKNLRNDLLTALWMSKHSGRQIISPKRWDDVRTITAYILKKIDPADAGEMFEKDKHRENSIKGQVKSQKVYVQPIHKLGDRINRAIAAIKSSQLQDKVLGND